MPIKARNMIPEDDPRVSQIGHPAPPWLVNYADLMTELVCFFVILYALSAALNKDMQKAQQEIQEMMKEGKLQGEVKMDKEGMRITLEEHGQFSFFESGRAEITAEMNEKLATVVPVLKKLSDRHDIIVEGHTDDVPIWTKQFASNWELSTARATSVVKYMLAAGFQPKRMAAIGYGEYHPVAPNSTADNRRKNRRVVFFVKNNPYPDAVPEKKAASAPEAAKPTILTPEEGPEQNTEAALPTPQQEGQEGEQL